MSDTNLPSKAVEYGNDRVEWSWWNGEVVVGSVERPFAFDTETELIKGPLHIPRLAMAMAFDGKKLYLIHPDSIARFVSVNRKQRWVGHNTKFDFWVLHEHLTGQPEQRILWDWADKNRISDSMILDQLLQLATGKFHRTFGARAGEDAKLIQANLSVVAEANGLPALDKDDPYRLRFGELLGFSIEQMESLAEFTGFVSYALTDVLATYRIYETQFAKAVEIVSRVKPPDNAAKNGYVILPNAVEKWGPLTEYIQVKAAIVLDEVSRCPLPIDQSERRMLEEGLRIQYQSYHDALLSEAPDLFKRYKAKRFEGRQKMTKRSLVPQMDQAVLKQTLQRIADERGFPAPQAEGKSGGISTSAKAWAKLAHQHTFIEAWVGIEKVSKKLEFVKTLDHDAVYSKYSLLMRTGRTSAGAHTEDRQRSLPSLNVQQMPRESDFRSLFVAPLGRVYGVVDFSYIELRTLAAVAAARFGKSNLKDAIVEHSKHGGLDPHQRTAATILGVDEESFVSLPKDVQKTARQQAKACFHPDTEVLTKRGWVGIRDVTMDDEVAQYWPGTDRIDFAKPLELTMRFDRPLVRIVNEGVDIRVTPDHRMVGYTTGGFPKVVTPLEMNKLRGIWNAGYVNSGQRYGALTENDIKRVVCVQADGSISHNQVRFGFKKKRKIERFRKLFDDYKESYIEKEGVTTFTVPWKAVYEAVLTKDKKFRVEVLLSLPRAWRETFVEEVRYWDSNSSRTTNRYMYSTVERINADAVQAVATITGKKATIHKQISSDDRKRDCYILSVKDRVHTRGDNFKIEELPGLYDVYCLSVPSSFVVVRDGGKTLIAGNCNFGFPGGLGTDKFRVYAEASYKVHFSPQEAKERKKQWLSTYPEMELWLADRTKFGLRYQLGPGVEYIVKNLSLPSLRLVSDLLRGLEQTAYAEDVAWRIVEELVTAAKRWDLAEDVESRTVTKALAQITTDYAVTLTGRVRANTGYTDGANTPFQGLAADGAKIALWDLRYRGYKIAIFVHDEIVVDLPEDTAEIEVKRVEKLMNAAMESVLDGIPCAVESEVSKSWSKP